ncbi:unnamed protein product, partial [Brassica oleracea var. botrytis]
CYYDIYTNYYTFVFMFWIGKESGLYMYIYPSSICSHFLYYLCVDLELLEIFHDHIDHFIIWRF